MTKKTDKNTHQDRPDNANKPTIPPDKEKDSEAYRQHLNYIMYCDAWP